MKWNIILIYCFLIILKLSCAQVTFPDSSQTTSSKPQGTTTTTSTTTTTKPPTTIASTTTVTNTPATTPTSVVTSSAARTTIQATSTLRGSGTTPQPNNCICVPVNSCRASLGGNLSLTDGGGQINPRIVNPSRLPSSTFGTNESVTTPASTGITIQTASPTSCTINTLELCCPKEAFKCGVSYPPVNGSIAPQGRANFGQFPWHGIIFTVDVSYVGSGALIDQNHLITVAHRLDRFSGSKFKVRLGDWDTSNRNEPIPYMEFNVSKVIIHPKYTSINLQNNIAIMKLSSSVPLGQFPTVSIACLPSIPILAPMRCWVSGWGRNDFYFGSNQPQQRCVDIPIIDFDRCENILRQTKLGRNFILDKTSFMCAGGESGKDACTGDGGAPLVCYVRGQWFVTGLVAWGVSCAQSVPGVYMNVTNYIPWIQSVTKLP